MQVMRHRRRLLLLQHAPRLAVTQPGLLHEFKRLREGDEQGHGGGSLQWLTVVDGGIPLPLIPLPTW